MNEHLDSPKQSAGFQANLPQAGRAVPVEPAQTLLAAAIASGVDYPHGCRSGRCGSCKSRLACGSVTMLAHTRSSLTEEEKAAGLILACRAVPPSDVTVMWTAATWGQGTPPGAWKVLSPRYRRPPTTSSSSCYAG